MQKDSQIPLVDIGVNLNSGQYKGDLLEVFARSMDAGVLGLIAIASDIEESVALQIFDQKSPIQIWRTAGVHPHLAKGCEPDWLTQLATLIQSSRCVALGECGLDFYRNYSPKPVQLSVFQSQAEMAFERRVPIYLHERAAHTELCQILERVYGQNEVRGVLHCFTGSTEELRRYLDFGLYIGITGWVSDERRGDSLRESVRYIPNDRLLFETDGPYLRPRTYQGPIAGKRNEPALLRQILHDVAVLRNVDPDQLAQTTLQNTETLFQIALRPASVSV